MSPRMQRLGLARDDAERDVYKRVQSLYADMRRRRIASQGFHPGVIEPLRTFATAVINEAIAFDERTSETELARLKATGNCRNPFDERQVDELNLFVDQSIRSMLGRIECQPKGRAICGGLAGRQREDLLAQLCETARRRVLAEYAERRERFDVAKLKSTVDARHRLHATDQEHPPTTGGNEQSEGAGEQFIFAENGTGYFIKGFGESGHVKKLKGFTYLAKLVAQPGTPILMTELLAATSHKASAVTAHSAADAAELLGGEPSDTADQKRLRLANDSKRSRQPVMDAQAKREAYERLQELNEEIDDAKADNDPARQTEAMKEKEQIMDELQAATGILGKDRDLNAQTNKLRPRIQNRLTDAYKALRVSKPPMPELANHFEAAVSASGDTFVYSPPFSVCWRNGE